MTNEIWLSPKDIYKETFVSPARLRYYRLKGFLKNTRPSPGKTPKAGITFYDLNEVKQVFQLDNTANTANTTNTE